MEYRYLTAVAPGTLVTFDDLPPANWLDPRTHGTPLHHPAILASYWLWKQDIPAELRDGTFIFGDSGGFSVVAEGARISPAASLRWQIRNCTVGPILDIPPYDFGGKSRFVGAAAERFKESLRRTVHNVQTGLPIYEKAREDGIGFRWWGVVQGEARDQMEAWYKAVSAVYPFADEGEGWALSAYPANTPLAIAWTFGLARDVGLKRVHVFKTAELSSVGTIIALAHMAGIESVTNDSASSYINAANRNMLVPSKDGLDAVWMGVHRAGWEVLRDTLAERVPHSPIPELWTQGMEAGAPERFNVAMLAMHNLWAHRTTTTRMMEMAADDPRKLLNRCLGADVGEVLREYQGVIRTPAAKGRVSLFDRLRKT